MIIKTAKRFDYSGTNESIKITVSIYYYLNLKTFLPKMFYRKEGGAGVLNFGTVTLCL